MYYYLLFAVLGCIIGAVCGSSLNLNNEEIAEYALVMETEIPGSLDYLAQWARDEVALDNFQRILNGEFPPPTSARFRGEISMFLLSTDPSIQPEAIIARLELIGVTMSLEEVSELVAVARAPTRIPEWLHNIFAESHARNASWRTLFPTLERTINYFKRKGWIVNTDRRFKGGAKRWYTLYYLWKNFCMNNPSAASLDPTTNEWVMSDETQRAVFRYTAISMNNDTEQV